MKKFMLGACALMALAVASCGKCDGDKCATATDSLSTAYGNYVGAMIYSDFNQMNNITADERKDFLKGMQIVMGAKDADRNTRMGMQVALQMLSELEQLDNQGISLDKKEVFAAFKKTFMTDSLNFIQVQALATNFQTLFTKAQAEAEAAEAEAKNAEPEAVQNGMIAEQYIADLVAENPDAKTTESGLVYVIENAGEGAHPDETATVEVNYTGSLVNGTVFDTSEGRGPATFPLQGVIPGFREGLMLLGKGGKATLYIPGNLAYGANGAPQAGIGPNEMLIFQVELLDIK